MDHWSRVKLNELDTRGLDLNSHCDFKKSVREKSPLKAVRLTFKKSEISILDEFIELYGKEKLSEYILRTLKNDKDWKSNNTLQQSFKF
jgi:S-adenosylmethionine:tRNA-ribosyltransferase-isomerase (queuine synthetase)